MSFNEAPASVNISFKRADGFIVQLTLRDENGSEALERLDAAIQKITAEGGIPYERTSGGFPKKEKKYVEGRTCPNDGGKLYESTTKTGKKMIKCENGKWDVLQKRNIGCDYVEWL